MKITIREATPRDFKRFYGKNPPVTVRALVAIKNRKIECIAGVTLEKGVMVAFSDMRAEGATKFEIFRTARKMAEWMKQFHPMVAKWDGTKDTSKFLEMLGFKFVTRKYDALNIYRL